jgi:hypothetical protein
MPGVDNVPLVIIAKALELLGGGWLGRASA